MSDTMRERIARAIYDVLEGPVNNQDFGRQSRQWAQSLDIADAVLDAIREPSDEMLDALSRYDFTSKHDPSWTDCWHVMVDAIKGGA